MSFTTKNKEYKNTRGGYTIIELIVSMGLFLAAVLMASSSFLGVMSANRKALAMRTAMDNLNFAIESMTRDMKTGTAYHCGSSAFAFINEPRDCPNGNIYIAFEGQSGNPTTNADQIVYQRGNPVFPNCKDIGQICRSATGGVPNSSFFAMTAPQPELSINGLAFRVYGSAQSSVGDMNQPRITIVILGSVGAGSAASTFDIQTTVSQRLPDT